MKNIELAMMFFWHVLTTVKPKFYYVSSFSFNSQNPLVVVVVAYGISEVMTNLR